MRNLVTGGAGFIGAHIVQQLLGRGEEVRVLDLHTAHIPKGAEIIQGSATDEQVVNQAMADVDAVFHLAANAHLWACDPKIYDEVNVGGTRTVLGAARNQGVKKFVHVSSLTTLVGKSTPRKTSRVDEAGELGPAELFGPYPRSKRLAELCVNEAVNNGLDATIVLPTMPVGPGDFGLTGPTKMLLDLVNGKTPAYLDCMMNLIDARDVAPTCIAARDVGKTGWRYILGGDNISMSDLLSVLGEISRRPMPKTKAPLLLALAAAYGGEWVSNTFTHKAPVAPLTGVHLAGRKVLFDTSRARQELGLKNRPLTESLTDTLQWFEDHNMLAAQKT